MNLFIIQSHLTPQKAAQHLPMGQTENHLHQRNSKWRPALTLAQASKTKTQSLELIVLSSIQQTQSFPVKLLIRAILIIQF